MALLQGYLLFQRKNQANRCIVERQEEEHTEGAYYLYHSKNWIPVGADALEAQRRRNAQHDHYELNRLRGIVPAQNPAAATIIGKTPLAAASQQYFSNLEARGVAPKTIATYRTAVEQFLGNCTTTSVEDVIKQDIINFMGWLRRQQVPQRRNSNPDRTYANKVGHFSQPRTEGLLRSGGLAAY